MRGVSGFQVGRARRNALDRSLADLEVGGDLHPLIAQVTRQLVEIILAEWTLEQDKIISSAGTK